jgi:hypothetical protein
MSDEMSVYFTEYVPSSRPFCGRGFGGRVVSGLIDGVVGDAVGVALMTGDGEPASASVCSVCELPVPAAINPAAEPAMKVTTTTTTTQNHHRFQNGVDFGRAGGGGGGGGSDDMEPPRFCVGGRVRRPVA